LIRLPVACLATALVLAVGWFVACGGGKKSAIAELKQADGPVERQAASETTWGKVDLGQEYFLGDAARTGDGGAQLELVGGGAQIAMQKHTVLRFGGKSGQSRISVELGAIDLSGTGNYDLDVGAVKLAKNGKVRITARGDGKSEIKLTLGEAQVTSLTGQTVNLVLDVGVDFGAAVVTAIVDAAVPEDAPAVDAPPPPPASGATIVATGKKVEMQVPGDPKWTAVEEGASVDLPKGAKVRVGAGSSAKLTSGGTTLALGGGSRAQLTDTSVLDMEVGNGVMTAAENGAVNLPGGAMTIRTGKDPSEVRLDTGGGGMKVTITRGGGRLTGTGGSLLDMNRGESATLLRNGQIRPLEAIPNYFDMQITAGEGNFTIHDPRPPTAVQFQFAGKCTDGGIIEMDRDPRFRTAKVSAGKDFANHLVKGGAWHYRLRCSTGGVDGNAVASGRIAVVADAGSRKLPAKPGASPFTPNGMTWKIGYQSVIPDLAVTFPGAGSSFVLHLARGGKAMTFPASSTKLKIPGKDLSEGVYTYWFDREGVKQDKTGQLKIEFDQTAPQVYIELPVNGKPWAAGDIDVKGAVLPGWSAAVGSASIPIDGARRFIAKVGQPPGNALAIKLSHPQRGVHYYLRRGK
jgi:hypothetical protein